MTFRVKDKTGGLREVCEGSFLYALGYIHSRNASDAPSVYVNFKNAKLNPNAELNLGSGKDKVSMRNTTSRKVTAYIKIL